MVLGMLHSSVQPSRSVQMIAVEDIAWFAARAFSDPERWIGRNVELAGDALTLSDIRGRLAVAEGHPDREIPSLAQEAGGTEMMLMARWFDEHGHAADIDALRLERLACSILTGGWGAIHWRWGNPGTMRRCLTPPRSRPTSVV